MANVNVIQEVEGFSFVRWLSLNEERLGLHITGWISGCDVYVRRTWRSNMHLCRIDNAWGEGDTTVKVYGETTRFSPLSRIHPILSLKCTTTRRRRTNKLHHHSGKLPLTLLSSGVQHQLISAF